VGYSGYLVLGRAGGTLADLPAVSAFGENLGDGARLEDGWQLLQVDAEEPDPDSAVAALVAATGHPALVAYVLDSDCAVVKASGPDGSRWSATLNPVVAEDYGAPPTGDLDTTVAAARAWSAAAGLTPSEADLRAALSEDATFAEDLCSRLLVGLGIPGASAEEGED
jgi:hypothetical protein